MWCRGPGGEQRNGGSRKSYELKRIAERRIRRSKSARSQDWSWTLKEGYEKVEISCLLQIRADQWRLRLSGSGGNWKWGWQGPYWRSGSGVLVEGAASWLLWSWVKFGQHNALCLVVSTLLNTEHVCQYNSEKNCQRDDHSEFGSWLFVRETQRKVTYRNVVLSWLKSPATMIIASSNMLVIGSISLDFYRILQDHIVA